MGMYGAVIKKYKKTDDKVIALRADAGAFQSGTEAALRFLYVVVSVLVFGTGVVVFFSGEITVGAVFASVLMMIRLLYPLERSLLDMKISIEAMAAYSRLKEFVNMEKQKDMLSLPAPDGKFDMEAISLALNGRTILHNIAFSLEPGESLGIFGPSSAGKTSLCKAMLGIWPATAGKVRLDGAEISQWPRDEFGGYVGYLPQETELFPANVAENISRLQEVDSEKVVKAAQKAGVHEMLLKLPQGYDTQIDLTGKNLSAAQRQLISLARALYGDPKFVVMDEPHTHLDDLGFKILLQALARLKIEKTTTVIVTDRPNLLVNMDKILVIKDGQVAMYGPAKDVLNQLVNRQQPQAAGV
jgi:ABC-type protease/lipase transport system fused ATPase/permease subunit